MAAANAPGRLNNVRHAARPASGWNAAQLDRLPLILLIRMREEIVGSLNNSVDVIGLAGEGFYQGAHVSQDGEITGIVKSGKFRCGGGHTLGPRSKSHERTLPESKPTHRRAASFPLIVPTPRFCPP